MRNLITSALLFSVLNSSVSFASSFVYEPQVLTAEHSVTSSGSKLPQRTEASLSFTALEVNDSKVILPYDTMPGWPARDAFNFYFKADNTGYSSNASWLERHQSQTFNWQLDNGKIIINQTALTPEERWVYYPYSDIASQYGQTVADELIRLKDNFQITNPQLITEYSGIVRHELTKLTDDGNKARIAHTFDIKTQLSIPMEWQWQGPAAITASQQQREADYFYNSDSLLNAVTAEALIDTTWAIHTYRQHQHGEQYARNQLLAGTYADLLTLQPNGSVSSTYSDFNFSWQLLNGQLRLTDGAHLFIITPRLQQAGNYLAQIEYWQNGQLAQIYSSQMIKLEADNSNLIDNLVTRIPEIYVAGINNYYPHAWQNTTPWQENIIAAEQFFGYQFKANGELNRGLYIDPRDADKPVYVNGAAWQYQIIDNQLKQSYRSSSTERERTWHLLRTDESGRTYVLESSVIGYDADFNGIIDENERGSFIPPRINVLHRYNMMADTQVWNNIRDTDSDGLNDIIETDIGTSVDNADTDNDGYSDGYEVNNGTNPQDAGSAPTPLPLHFSRQELLQSPLLMPADTIDGWLPRQADSVMFYADGSATHGNSEWHEQHLSQTINWQLLDGKLSLNFSQFVQTQRYYSYPFADIEAVYGFATAHELRFLADQSQIPRIFQLTELSGPAQQTIEKITLSNDATTIQLTTVNYRALQLPTDWRWFNFTPPEVRYETTEQRQLMRPSAGIALPSTLAASQWAMQTYRGHQYGPMLDDKYVHGTFADLLSFNANNTLTMQNDPSTYNWQTLNGKWRLNYHVHRYEVTPYRQQGDAYLVQVAHYQNDQLVSLYSSQLVKRNATTAEFLNNLHTALPEVYLTSINNYTPTSWQYDLPWQQNTLVPEQLYGYQFAPGNTLRHGIYIDTQSSENSVNMGQQWQYTASGNSINMTFTDDWRARQRQWQVLQVDNQGRIYVLEQADWDIDLDSNGSFTPNERGNYIAPRINVITRYDLSKHTQEWQALPDTDNDGLNDYIETDIGTNPNLADSDNDGLNDGDELQAGTDPLNSDTDGDGLQDGTDPIPDGVTITVQASTGGIVSPGTIEILRGSNATFQLTPESGYKIHKINGCTGSHSGLQFITTELQQSCTLSVDFKRKARRNKMLLLLMSEGIAN
ncbi:thrombospondin type 3 repeat-containing protein [Rheinheimera baltica]|uniref:thrombospondin type 3 repeat-containing protein n=1 Tax=Rheinheimera baltica TaxID=67576 RepID=UPI00273D35D6|nr:hypothetical protein [Rheinheimera baltica]MDP5149758.1 hypothetical protein [Rheinheimera baltica]